MKADVKQVLESFATSQRHAYELMGVAVSSYRYQLKGDGNQALRERVVDLAREKPRFG